MTHLTEEQYIEQGGMACPICSSTEGVNKDDPPEYYAGGMNQDEWCSDCGSCWFSAYQLVGYEIINTRIVSDLLEKEEI